MFKLEQNNTTIGREVVAGITTFFTMVYIIFVNPNILSETGMSRNGVFVATIIAAIVGTLVMALVANVPYAVAPGMGLNAFFTYTICFGLGFAWQEAMAMVFICGLINILITVTKVRKSIIKAIPRSLQMAVGGGIGLFIAYIGLKNADFLTFNVTNVDEFGNVGGADVVPSLINFDNPGALLALFGLVLIVILMVFRVKGAMFIGIIATTAASLIYTFISSGESPDWGTIFNVSKNLEAVSEVKDVWFSFFGSPGLGSLFSDPSRIFVVIVAVFAFSLSDTFDTIGTFIGTGRKTGIFDDADEAALESGSGFKSKMDKALFADATATSIGALFGTSNTTTYIESSAGINAGGRTGLTSVVTAAMFALCLPFALFFGLVPAQATAPVLIIVGVLMAESFAGINWKDFDDALPAFLTVAVMALAYNISYGIAAGFIFYVLIKLLRGKAKEVHPILYASAVLFIVNFVVLAIEGM